MRYNPWPFIILISALILLSLIIIKEEYNSSVPIVQHEKAFNYLEMQKLATREEVYEKIDNQIRNCRSIISKNSESILKLMKDNVIITKEGYSKSDIENLYCIDCLSLWVAYKNITTNNVFIYFFHHNRFYSDVSFGESVVCEINPSYEVTKLYVSAQVGPAS